LNTSLWQLLKEKVINHVSDVHSQRRLPSVLQTIERNKYPINKAIIKTLKNTLDLSIKPNKPWPH
jgi:hypothetical protein